MKIWKCVRVGLLLVFFLSGTVVAAEPGWHVPGSAPERTLDRLLKTADADDGLLDNLLSGRGKKGFRPSVDYGASVTPALLRSIRLVERQLVKQTCGGRYTGEVCGLDYSPISCAQDNSDHYLYRTLAQTDHSAVVSYAWPPENASETPSAIAEFRLVEANGSWRLDGVKCVELHTSFHMP